MSCYCPYCSGYVRSPYSDASSTYAFQELTLLSSASSTSPTSPLSDDTTEITTSTVAHRSLSEQLQAARVKEAYCDGVAAAAIQIADDALILGNQLPTDEAINALEEAESLVLKAIRSVKKARQAIELLEQQGMLDNEELAGAGVGNVQYTEI